MKKNKKNQTTKKQPNTALREKFYTISIIMLIIVICVVLIIGAYNSSFAFWNKSNELRIITQLVPAEGEENEITSQDPTVKKNTDETLTEKINTLKSGIAEFFSEAYNVDVTSKLDKLKDVYIFSLDENPNTGILYGYCDSELNTINLNDSILDDEVLFNSVFVHETMHYLGIIHRTFNGQYFIEGIADALTYQCLEFLNKEFDATYTSYYTQRELALQIIAVDKELVVNAITQDDFEIMDRINEVLKDVPRTVFPCDNVAETLEILVNGLLYNNSSLESSELTTKISLFIGQEIVASYCKEFKPSKKEISEIRKHYVVENFESRTVVVEGDNVRLY